MRDFLNRLTKIVAYSAAGIVILLAVLVGLFRLMLPRLPEYQEEIKTWTGNAIGIKVEFSNMDARWGLSGPELNFYDAELLREETGTRLLAAEEVRVSVALTRLLVDRTLIVDRVTVRDTSVEVRRVAADQWWVQGIPADELLEKRPRTDGDLGSVELVVEDVDVHFLDIGDERPTTFTVPRVRLSSNDERLSVDAGVRPPPGIGRQLRVQAMQLPDDAAGTPTWYLAVEADDANLAGLVSLADSGIAIPPLVGTGDFSMSVSLAGNRVQSGTATIAFDGVALAGRGPSTLRGRLDYRRDDDGWLLAADEMAVETPNGAWPETSLRLEAGVGADGRVAMLDFSAGYVNLDDIHLVLPLLDAPHRERLEALRPEGTVRELVGTLSDIGSDSPGYSLSVELDGAGVAPYRSWPGVRGFSGRLRADRSGGRLEIVSENMTIEVPEYLSLPLPIDDAYGTVIWRTSGGHTTILSDSISIRNADFASESNVEVQINGDDAPVIDLASDWSITDIGSVKRFIPKPLLHPDLYRWFQMALVSGRIPVGSTQLHGPLNRFPFDGGEGRLLVQANVHDATFRFLDNWPAAEIVDLDVVLDNTRLYSTRNRSVNQGRIVVDASVEIADLRKPVLEIDAESSGTLKSIRDYVVASPIGDWFGGQLDRVSVAGDADFALDLTVPILSWRDFAFEARVAGKGGVLRVDGFSPPVTELEGSVTISRDTIESERLTGRFLGEPVAIELVKAPAALPGYQVIATATGTATAAGLVQGLGLPAGDLLAGRTDYTAELRFPATGQEQAEPFTVAMESNLNGLAVLLPKPFGKQAEELKPVSGDIRFATEGSRIDSHGEFGADVGWQLKFAATDGRWDFDRGILALGGAAAALPDTRGLHILGATDYVRFEDWLALAGGGGKQPNVLSRIRSIDVAIADLRVLGQRLFDHHVRIDRGARDWRVDVDGESVAGSIVVPYSFSQDRVLELDMQRLILPGGDEPEADGEEPPVDPRSLPSISIRAGEFGFGSRRFGSLTAELVRSGSGLVAERIVADDDTFDITGSGRWLADETDPSGYRSHFEAVLKSTDVQRTMLRLDYEPGIVSEAMSLVFDLSWSGGPGTDVLETLDGEVSVDFGSGQLDDVEPGAGRVFGLMSIVALPRRLSLDFRDVFQKGFGFDQITGTFRLVDGVAYTCDLSLEGPAADIGIVGRAALAGRTYEQTAVVSANVGNTLPVVGAVVAGPQVAAALLIFSQIFKKPLKDLGQIYYAIEGPWDDPDIESVDAARFARSGRLAGCIDDAD